MSLNAAFFAAGTGLSATARNASVVADNIANSGTEGFAARQLGLSSMGAGGHAGGVRVSGVQRLADPGQTAALRLSGATDAAASEVQAFWRDMETLVGTDGAPGALTARIDALGAAMIQATSEPDRDVHLARIAQDARDLARTFSRIETGITDSRTDADARIARDVAALNTALQQVERLNTEIARTLVMGADANGLLDERQRVIDALSRIVPVHEMPRPNGAVRLISTGGAVLLHTSAVEIDFTPSPHVGPGQDLASGWLSGLTINGRPVETGPDGPLAGGALAARFEIRDRLAPELQAGLDRLAADLQDRFAAPATDPTLPPGAPGLLADTDPAAGTVGLAGRLRLNSLADPEQGGALWRLRSGLGALGPGPVGDPVRLDAMARALAERSHLAPDSAARDTAAHVGAWLSTIGLQRHGADGARAFSAATDAHLRDGRATGGVDTDAELTRLLEIEKAYAANARVIRAVDDMLRRLLEI